MHNLDMILDLQYGSTGKGLIAGHLGFRRDYDTAICAFATNAGHTWKMGGREVMTQQIPTAGVVSPTVKRILIGPGAAICPETFLREYVQYERALAGKEILIHPHAAIVLPHHADFEVKDGRTKMGSTAKGVGEAYIERIRRKPGANVAKNWRQWASQEHELGMAPFITTEEKYRSALNAAESVIVEGAQGFSLSMYHGQYPYTTSRDVTPMQVMADCGIPFKWGNYAHVIGTLRTFPIRVNNRDGSSGPCYPDQHEISFEDVGVPPELTTVTKLPRRIFTFSRQQLDEALFHCGGYWKTSLFLNFANYCKDDSEVRALIERIEEPRLTCLNPAKVEWLGFGADDGMVLTRAEYNESVGHHRV